MESRLRLTVLLPCRNEEKFIGNCLKTLIESDYPNNEMEILVLDGMSTDDTRSIVTQITDEYPFVKLVDNPERTVPYALNRGISAAKGEYIIRVDAHCFYPQNYFSYLINWHQKLNADNVGVVIKTIGVNEGAKCVSIINVLTDKFGVGDSLFRVGMAEEYRLADTVPFGCFKKELFNEVGGFDNRLTRGQDIEFNRRLTQKGKKIYLLSGIKLSYYAVPTYSALFNKYIKTGEWVIKVAYFTNSLKSISLRHLIPLFFVLSVLLPLVLLPFSSKMVYLSLFILTAYSLSMLVRSAIIGQSRMLMVFWGFLTIHTAYGLGSLKGLFFVLFGAKK